MKEQELLNLGFEKVEFQPGDSLEKDYYLEYAIKESKNKYGTFYLFTDPASEGYDNYYVFMADYDTHFEFRTLDDVITLLNLLNRNRL